MLVRFYYAQGMDDAAKLVEIKKLADQAWIALSNEHADRQILLEGLIEGVWHVIELR